MSNICTHLACRVRWIEEREQFFCPCHNRAFDKEGNVLFVPLALSFVLCMAGFSATINQAGIVLPATGRFIGLGTSWLIGHELHGAAVFAVPVFCLAHNRPSARKLGIGSGC